VNGCSDPFLSVNNQFHFFNFTTVVNVNGFLECAGSNEVPTLNTIDNYMTRLHSLLLDSTTQDREALLATVRELVGRLEFHG
jgi:hypothetical protein